MTPQELMNVMAEYLTTLSASERTHTYVVDGFPGGNYMKTYQVITNIQTPQHLIICNPDR